MSTERNHLLFVYNADGGLFNTMTDIAHKIFSPETYACQLCALTHGYLHERRAWREFIETLPCPCMFLHRDELQQRYPQLETVPLPAIFLVTADNPEVAGTSEEIGRCPDLAALQQLVARCCERLHTIGNA